MNDNLNMRRGDSLNSSLPGLFLSFFIIEIDYDYQEHSFLVNFQ